MAEFFFATAMRIVPRRYRVQITMQVARVVVPLMRLTASYREQQIKNFHTPQEIALFLLLHALTRNGIRFDIDIGVSGYEQLQRARASGSGVLVIGHHAALTLLMIRLFHDKGLRPIVITPDDAMRIPGTKQKARTLKPSPMFLVRVRSRLRDGELVCAMPDRGNHHSGRTVEFAMPTGRIIVAPAIIDVAARCGAQLIFTEVHVGRGRLVSTITAASCSSPDARALTENFVTFVRACTSKQTVRRHATRSLPAFDSPVQEPASSAFPQA